MTWLIAGTSTISYLFFYNKLGNLSPLLIYDTNPSFHMKELLLNIIVFVIVAIIFFYLWIKHSNIVKNVILMLCIVSIIISSVNIVSINKKAVESIASMKSTMNTDDQILPLSKTQKNVVVIMLDRAIGEYFPYIVNEKPILLEQFSGFIYYPNTISFGAVTNIGAPGIFGGYEYTPEEMNKRNTELLMDKHNEALKVMPVLFDDNNYRVVVCDAPYANYQWHFDSSVYSDYPNIKGYMLEGRFLNNDDSMFDNLKRNLFTYSLTKICPMFLFSIIYDSGYYLNPENTISENYRITEFRNWFDALTHLNPMTYFTSDDKGSFLMIQNSVTHYPLYLSEPDYEIDYNIDQSNENVSKIINSIDGSTMTLKNRSQLTTYHVNVASLLELGKWFDYLKENDVYDNTRIIIVSDHAWPLYINKETYLEGDDIRLYNCLYLYKDFDSDEFTISDDFMTNADTPYLLTNGLIDNPINPFTAKKIEYKNKEGETFHVFASTKWEVEENNGYTFIDDGKWYAVHDDCLDIDNWSIIKDHDK